MTDFYNNSETLEANKLENIVNEQAKSYVSNTLGKLNFMEHWKNSEGIDLIDYQINDLPLVVSVPYFTEKIIARTIYNSLIDNSYNSDDEFFVDFEKASNEFVENYFANEEYKDMRLFYYDKLDGSCDYKEFLRIVYAFKYNIFETDPKKNMTRKEFIEEIFFADPCFVSGWSYSDIANLD